MIKEPVITPIDMGRGHKRNETTKKYEVDLTDYVDNKSVKINKDGKLNVEFPEQKSGLDCDAIDALPERTWKKGTTVLAKQDGECVRLQATADLFADIVVALDATKWSMEIEKGKTVESTLIATVTHHKK